MAWDDGLTGTALEIARTDATPLRVMAGPGTGKSFAMKRRVARLLEAGQDPAKILAVTFTRNAAASLVSDLHALEIENCEKIRAGTLHSLCFSILNREDVFHYLNRVPRPLVTVNGRGVLQFEGAAILHDLVRGGRFGTRTDCTKQIRAFEAAWARLQSEEPGWALTETDQEFERRLVEWLRFHHAMLIGELVPETLRFLRDNPASEVRSHFEHVIVDEYQDLNKAEQVLIDILATNGDLSIVGDEDQSIYSFRHANPSGISDFSELHPDTNDQTLDECRRCPGRVVGIADELIRHNHVPTEGHRLLPRYANPDGVVRIVQWRDLENEADGLATFVNDLIVGRGYDAGDILVMTPSRRLGYEIRDRLDAANAPVHSFFSEEPLEAFDAQRAFAILALLCNPDDRVALRWWLGSSSSSGLAGEYQILRRYCEQNGEAPRQALDAVCDGMLPMAGVSRIVAKYQELRGILLGLEGLDIDSLVNNLFPEGQREVSMLREAALETIQTIDDLDGVYANLKTRITQPDIPQESEHVRLMTLHKAKGLTSKIAIVTGCVQGLIPRLDFDATEEEQARTLEEQRRLFYVAITRCTEVLVLSSAIRMESSLAHRMRVPFPGRGRGLVNVLASQFIRELGPGAPQPVAGEDWAERGYEL